MYDRLQHGFVHSLQSLPSLFGGFYFDSYKTYLDCDNNILKFPNEAILILAVTGPIL